MSHEASARVGWPAQRGREAMWKGRWCKDLTRAMLAHAARRCISQGTMSISNVFSPKPQSRRNPNPKHELNNEDAGWQRGASGGAHRASRAHDEADGLLLGEAGIHGTAQAVPMASGRHRLAPCMTRLEQNAAIHRNRPVPQGANHSSRNCWREDADAERPAA